MKLNLLFFGVLTDATGLSSCPSNEESLNTVSALDSFIQKKFPEIKKHAYKIAVNQKIVPASHLLYEGDEVAFLPPFAGG